MRILERIISIAVAPEVHRDDGAATLVRLVDSRHVADLRFLANSILLLFLVLAIGALVSNLAREIIPLMEQSRTIPTLPEDIAWNYFKVVLSAILDTTKFVGSILPLTIGVCAWAYKSASARLGIVDLFSSEIGTLCRVMTIVGMVERCTSSYERMSQPQDPGAPANPVPASRFLSNEDYTSIYDGNAKSLQDLDVSVIADSTQFYTYYKSMRDCLRRFVDLRADCTLLTNLDPVRQALIDVIYMQFLALESGRSAITYLVEYRPVLIKETITILLSEMLAYGFLMEHLKDDFRYPRLEMRRTGYYTLFEGVRTETLNSSGHDWMKARTTLKELELRFAAVFPDYAKDYQDHPAHARK